MRRPDGTIVQFEELPIEEQEKWNGFAAKNQQLIGSLIGLNVHGCIFCKNKFTRYSEMEQHIHSSHGISPEILLIMMKEGKHG